jgi:aminotransferase
MFYDWEKEIIVTAGSIEGITASIFAITNPGDEVIIPEPTYTSYREVITLAGCKPVFVPLDEERGWALDISLYEKAITDKTKAIFYCNPNNPTGTIYSKEQLLQLAELAKKYNLFLISDEVYKDFIYGNNQQIFSLAEIPELRKRVIRLFSFSKAYAMTGWRVGYVHADESIVKEILKVHDSLVTCAPVISQYAAMGALEMGERDVRMFNQEYEQRRNLICEKLDKIPAFEYVRPTSSYYVFPRLRRCINEKTEIINRDRGEMINSWEFAMDLLDKTQVAVVPGFAFGDNGEGHVRMSFGRSREDIKKALDRIGECLNK